MFGAIAWLALLALQQSAPAAAAPACASEDHAGFDFWVGEWDVYPTADPGRLVAYSRIERLHAGCAIREQWMPLGGTGGSSLSHFDPASGRWRQLWIGSAPGSVAFEGGIAEGEMVLTGWWPGAGPNGEDGLIRMTYRAEGDGEVRQHGEFSSDQGRSWSDNFDFTYRRRSEALPD